MFEECSLPWRTALVLVHFQLDTRVSLRTGSLIYSSLDICEGERVLNLMKAILWFAWKCDLLPKSTATHTQYNQLNWVNDFNLNYIFIKHFSQYTWFQNRKSILVWIYAKVKGSWIWWKPYSLWFAWKCDLHLPKPTPTHTHKQYNQLSWVNDFNLNDIFI